MAEEDLERSEPATERRRDELRKQGRVFHSMEASSTAVYVAVVIALYFVASSMVAGLVTINREFLGHAGELTLDNGGARSIFIKVGMDMGRILFPVFLTGMVIAVLANIMQFGFLFTTEPFEFDLSKLNPLEGMKRFASIKTMFEAVKAIIKLGLAGYVTYSWMSKRIDILYQLPEMNAEQIVGTLGQLLWSLSLSVIILMVIIAAVDYIFQKYEFEQSIKMTKQEILEEIKSQEGDPKIKGRIRAVQREMSMNRMMSQVPKASVVVTNPTHIAVALRYVPEEMDAPEVVAKGADFMAEKIKEVAKEHNIPIMEDKPLARTLYKTVDIGHAIPEKLYKAVAEILAYIYKLKKMRAGRVV